MILQIGNWYSKFSSLRVAMSVLNSIFFLFWYYTYIGVGFGGMLVVYIFKPEVTLPRTDSGKQQGYPEFAPPPLKPFASSLFSAHSK